MVHNALVANHSSSNAITAVRILTCITACTDTPRLLSSSFCRFPFCFVRFYPPSKSISTLTDLLVLSDENFKCLLMHNVRLGWPHKAVRDRAGDPTAARRPKRLCGTLHWTPASNYLKNPWTSRIFHESLRGYHYSEARSLHCTAEDSSTAIGDLAC
ncbi:hypothetical protein SCLCIDRAFT_1134068 [Scleroderma citrinum Foug A]|uniref:Uncharacterized protein n=1 Tax=Scleroderma citrinum Foug A TaxID=1036808 RepID=A0A0C2Z5V1_9AGAM|nr:hypothetical protein SCLCIDRAFT_1134068 [Scleroderma citrinum Foug A]